MAAQGRTWLAGKGPIRGVSPKFGFTLLNLLLTLLNLLCNNSREFNLVALLSNDYAPGPIINPANTSPKVTLIKIIIGVRASDCQSSSCRAAATTLIIDIAK